MKMFYEVPLECAMWWRSCPEHARRAFKRGKDMESVQRSPLRDIRAILRNLLSIANKQGPSLALTCSFLSFKPSLELDVLVSLPNGYGKSLFLALLPRHDEKSHQ